MLDDDITACVCMVSLRCRKLSPEETLAMLDELGLVRAWGRGPAVRLAPAQRSPAAPAQRSVRRESLGGRGRGRGARRKGRRAEVGRAAQVQVRHRRHAPGTARQPPGLERGAVLFRAGARQEPGRQLACSAAPNASPPRSATSSASGRPTSASRTTRARTAWPSTPRAAKACR